MSVKWIRSGKWFVVFCCDILDDPKIAEKLEVSKEEWSFKHEVGIDMGLEKFLATSDNGKIENPRLLTKGMKKLVKLQRRLSRKLRGSNNRKKAQLKLAREQERIANQRKDFHWKVAHFLIATYDLIAVEDLNIKKMLHDNSLSRNISDAGWAEFIRKLGYLAGSAGILIVVVDPAGTSQECSRCHAIVPKDLSVRIHKCPHCGLVLDRDVNSARIILYIARRTAGLAGTYACGDVAATLWSDCKASDVGETRTIFV
jgi:putative transposase